MTTGTTDRVDFIPKRGDVVRLKSGGPAMTVDSRADEYTGAVAAGVDLAKVDALCVYFDQGGQFHARWFADSMLKAAEE